MIRIVLTGFLLFSCFQIFPQGKALYFDGVDNLITINDGGIRPGDNFTLEGWFYIEDNSTYWKLLIGNNSSGWVNRPPSIYTFNNRNIEFEFADGAENFYLRVPENPLQLDKWNHIATTFDGTHYRLYVNGVRLQVDSTFAEGQTPVSTTIKHIGSSFIGKVDEIRFWSVARSHIEILEYMCREIPTNANPAGLVTHYDFNEGTGTTLTNKVSGAPDATLNDFEESDWVDSDAFNTWLGTTNEWNNSSNWSLGVPDQDDRIGIYEAPSPDISNQAYTVDIAVIGTGVTFEVEDGSSFSTVRGFINGGTTEIRGAFTPSIYEDLGTTEFNGSAPQTVPDGTFNNLILNNSSGTAIDFAGTNVVVKNDLTLQINNMVIPLNLHVKGDMFLNDPNTVFTIPSPNLLKVEGDFISTSTGLITDNGYFIINGTLTMASNLDGLGTVHAQDYEENYLVFQISTPTDGLPYSARTWLGAEDTDWWNLNNWGTNILPDATTAVTIHPVTNQPVVDGVGAVAGGLFIMGGTSLTVESGDLTVSGPGFVNNSGGNIVVDGGTLSYTAGGGNQMSNSGAITLNGGTFNSACDVFTNLEGGIITINAGSLFKHNRQLITYGTISINSNGSYIQDANGYFTDVYELGLFKVDGQDAYAECSGRGMRINQGSFEVTNNAELKVTRWMELFRDSPITFSDSKLTAGIQLDVKGNAIFNPVNSDITIGKLINNGSVTFDNCQVTINGDAEMREQSQLNVINGSSVNITD